MSSSSSSSLILDAPSAERNKDPIWNVLQSRVFVAPPSSSSPWRVLEIAAGTGAHMEYFGQQLLLQQQMQSGASFQWYPTDPDPRCRASQQARIERNSESFQRVVVSPPLALTLDAQGIQESETREVLERPPPFDVIININMIHISPWSATEGLMQVAGQLLRPGGVLYMYGPYRVNGTCVESNLRFEQYLKEQNPSYGLRDLEKVAETAAAQGLQLEGTVEMPANNLSVIFRKKL